MPLTLILAEGAMEQKGFIAMLSSLMSVAVLFFFVAIAMIACTLVGSLLFDLMPVLRNGDDRVRRPLVFPDVAARADTSGSADVYRISTSARRAACSPPLRAAA